MILRFVVVCKAVPYVGASIRERSRSGEAPQFEGVLSRHRCLGGAVRSTVADSRTIAGDAGHRLKHRS